MVAYVYSGILDEENDIEEENDTEEYEILEENWFNIFDKWTVKFVKK